MTDKEIIIDGVDVSEWTDEEVRYKFEKHSPKAIRQIAFDLYKQLKRKEQECEELKEELKECRIGIKDIYPENTEICKISEKYKQALDKIEKLIPKFDTSTECDYGDFDCENCSSLDEEIVCGYKLKKIIKGIINKVKEK